MKKSIVPLLAFLTTVTFAQATVKPVGGTEVGLERDPGNSIIHVNTDKDGVFTFANMKAGSYRLIVASPQREPGKAPVQTSRSNIKHGVSRVTSGPDGVKVVVAFGPGEPGKEKDEPIVIVVPKDGTKVTGTVVSCETQKDLTRAISDVAIIR